MPEPTPNITPEPTPSNEFFTTLADGTRSDYALHAELLDSPEGDAVERAQVAEAVKTMRAQGVPEDVIEELYGPLPK